MLTFYTDVQYEKITKKHCGNDKYGEYKTLAEAQNACAADYNCQGVFDQGCDGGKTDNFWLCPRNVLYSNSGFSCIYQRTGKFGYLFYSNSALIQN